MRLLLLILLSISLQVFKINFALEIENFNKNDLIADSESSYEFNEQKIGERNVRETKENKKEKSKISFFDKIKKKLPAKWKRPKQKEKHLEKRMFQAPMNPQLSLQITIEDINQILNLTANSSLLIRQEMDIRDMTRFIPDPLEYRSNKELIVHARSLRNNGQIMEFTFQPLETARWYDPSTGTTLGFMETEVMPINWLADAYTTVDKYALSVVNSCHTSYKKNFKPLEQRTPCFPDFYYDFRLYDRGGDPLNVYATEIYSTDNNLLNWYKQLLAKKMKQEIREHLLKRVMFDVYIGILWLQDTYRLTCIDIRPQKIIVRGESNGIYTGARSCSTSPNKLIYYDSMFTPVGFNWSIGRIQTWSYCMTIYYVACLADTDRNVGTYVHERIQRRSQANFLDELDCKKPITKELKHFLNHCLQTDFPGFTYNILMYHDGWVRPDYFAQ